MNIKHPQTFWRRVATLSFISVLLGVATSPAFAVDITGDTVTSDLTVEGSKISINDATDHFELRNGTNRFDFWHNNPGQWVWSHGATPTDVMSLDSSNILSLYDLGAASVNPAIVLNPGNPDATPVIPASILVDGDEVLTESSAFSAGFINTGNLWSQVSYQLFNHDEGLSLSHGTADGLNTTAMSGGSTDEQAEYSTAMSLGNTFGQYSTAMSGGEAWGNFSLAAGPSAYSTSVSSASFGRWNKTWGSSDLWVDTDPLFLIGNGTGYGSTFRSNALAVLKNGQTTLTNKEWKANSSAPLADPVSATDSGGEALVVDGHTVLNGKVIITVPQGDISMGAYQ